jgi:hypothetical protein
LRRFQRAFALRYQPGEKMRAPFVKVANASIPRTIALSCPVAGKPCTGTSAQEKQTYHPSASRLIVTVLDIPSNGRDRRSAMRPIEDQATVVQLRATQVTELLVHVALFCLIATSSGKGRS